MHFLNFSQKTSVFIELPNFALLPLPHQGQWQVCWIFHIDFIRMHFSLRNNFCHLWMDQHRICPKLFKIPEPTDMTIHWKALEEYFLMLLTVLVLIHFLTISQMICSQFSIN
jgi:hypothetical protein